jgi:oxygen-dependent protoporphyrinogen oxidase
VSHVVVVGGGISGLAAAWRVQQSRASVTVVEADRRLGGKIRTTSFAGRDVEEAADAFLARVPAAAELCRQVGLGDDLISPATGRAYIWTRGRLHPIPEGTVLGVPAGLGAIRRASMLSPAAKARAAIEPLLPRRAQTRGADVAVGRLVRARFGREVQERLVDPLVGGINAGRTEGLSAAVSAAAVASVAQSSRSLLLGLRAQRRAAPAAGAGGPVFYSVEGGLERLVVALGEALERGGATLRLGDAATSLHRSAAGWAVSTASGASIEADAVVVAVPAFVATALLAEVSPRVARMLGGIEYASVDLVTVQYPSSAVDLPEGSGFLVPRADGRLMTACTIVSQKWPHLGREGGDVLLRLSAGRFGDERSLALDDEELVGRLTGELAEAIPVRGEPSAWRASRWVRAFPQFAPGHLELVAAIEDDLAKAAPGVALAGAALRGVGIPACIMSGQAAADRVLDH